MDMSQLIFPMILLGVILIFGAVFLIVINSKKNKDKNNKSTAMNKSSDRNNSKAGSTSSEQRESIPKEDIFKFMEFDRIVDNMIVQENGTKYTMAIKCKGINYDLMSDMEQLAVEEGFITFLNTLRFPIQLYVQAQNIDLKGAINTYKQNASGIKEEYEEINKQYNDLLEQFDAKKEDIQRVEEQRNRVLNVYEYAADIINYVEKLSLNKNLLQRNFYVLVSYYSSEITVTDTFSKEETINLCYNELLTRAQSIISGLSSCSVTGVVLDSNELADLLYAAYNRDDKGLVSIKDAVESGFYRLYSTSEDVFLKRQDQLQKEIQEIAEVKAMDAIKKAIDEGSYISPQAEKLDVMEKTSKAAAEIVKKEPIPNEVKQKAKEILVEDFRKDKQKVLDEITIDDKKSTEKQNVSGDSNKNDNIDISNQKIQNDNNGTNNKDEQNNANNIPNEQILDDRMGFADDLATNNTSENTEKSNKVNNTTDDDDDLII